MEREVEECPTLLLPPTHFHSPFGKSARGSWLSQESMSCKHAYDEVAAHGTPSVLRAGM